MECSWFKCLLYSSLVFESVIVWDFRLVSFCFGITSAPDGDD